MKIDEYDVEKTLDYIANNGNLKSFFSIIQCEFNCSWGQITIFNLRHGIQESVYMSFKIRTSYSQTLP